MNRFRRIPSAGHFTYDTDARVTRSAIVSNVFHESERTELIVCGKKIPITQHIRLYRYRIGRWRHERRDVQLGSGVRR